MSQTGVLADLALRISTNTAELSSGLDKAKNSINKFSKDAADRSAKVKEGFGSIKEGVASMASSLTDKLGECTGGLGELAGSFPAVIAGIKGATAGMNMFRVALASTGIGLIVIALASLIAYFTQTKTGADLLSKGMAAISTVIKFLIDGLAALGGSLIKAFTNPKQAIQNLAKGIQDFVVSKIELLMSGIKGLGTAFKQLFSGQFAAAAKTAGGSLLDIARATNPVIWGIEAVGGVVDSVVEKYGEASALAKKAIKLEGDAQKLRDAKQKWLVKESEERVKIAELIKKITEEDKYSAAQRLAWVRQAQAMEKKLGETNIKFAQEELRIKKGLDSLGENMYEDDQKTAELAKQVNDVKKEAVDIQESLAGKYVEVLAQQKEQAATQQALNLAKAEELKLQKQLKTEYDKFVKDNKDAKPIAAKKADVKPKGTEKPLEQRVPMTVKPMDLTKLKENSEPIYTEYDKMIEYAKSSTDAMNNTLLSGVGLFAESMGLMLTGDLGFKSFFDSILLLVVDFAKQFGELLVGLGMAKVSLESIGISGIGAVIAGGALIALASATSALLSKGIDKKANGGISQGGITLVGERGPELVNLPKGSNVIRNNRTEELLKGSNNVNVSGNIRVSGEDIYIALEEYKRRNGNRY